MTADGTASNLCKVIFMIYFTACTDRTNSHHAAVAARKRQMKTVSKSPRRIVFTDAERVMAFNTIEQSRARREKSPRRKRNSNSNETQSCC